MVVGCKFDLAAKREVTLEEAEEWADHNGLTYIETSAATGPNLKEAFETAARLLVEAVKSGALALDESDDA